MLTFQKENNLKFIWTKNGITYLRKDEGTPAFTIKTEADLLRHGIHMQIKGGLKPPKIFSDTFFDQLFLKQKHLLG